MSEVLKPNILFLVLDSFRSDKCYGNNKTSKTPAIDSLIKSGVYFSQAISSSDATPTSLGCIFTAKYPSKTGIRFYRNHSKSTAFFDILKDYGYNRYGTVPLTSFFQTLTSDFEDRDIPNTKPAVLLYEGTGQQIIDRLESKNMKEPWIYFMHLLDLHVSGSAFVIPNELNNVQYGSTLYERAISATDVWIGRILEKINLKNTLVILTADHGTFIPVGEYDIHNIEKIQKIMQKGRKLVPFLEPFGLKLFFFLRNLISTIRRTKLKLTLTADEMRTLNDRLKWNLYDEIIRVPLILSGPGVPSGIMISSQVRLIDIFPTIVELIGMTSKDDMDGRSLVPLLHGKKLEELPVYIESSTTNVKSLGNVIGIRTYEYKYYRARDNPRKKINLYDLNNDPLEKINIASKKLDVVVEMERILTQIIKSQPVLNEREYIKNRISQKRLKLNLKG